MVGGVTVDLEGRTTLPGLWAAGEVTSTGLHGANRLASNSLLESMVYGAHAGLGASRAASQTDDDFHALPLENLAVEEPSERLDLEDIRNSLKSLMWRSVGVRRSKPDLVEALNTIATWQRYVLLRQFREPAGWELQNMLAIARVVTQAALQRDESRGVHYRTDAPQVDNENWRKRIAFRRSS
jgi:L-aspartate oxidase